MLSLRPAARFRPLETICHGSTSRLSLFTQVQAHRTTRNPQLHDFGRQASSSSSTRWKTRQSKDRFAKDAKVKGLMSRAAFKLLEINDKYRLFRPGNTVVDLGYAPGSWSQVAVSKTQPNGRILGIDIIPAQPPRGVSTIQGDFLDPAVQEEVRAYVQDPNRGRPKRSPFQSESEDDSEDNGIKDAFTEAELEDAGKSYIALSQQANSDGMASTWAEAEESSSSNSKQSVRQRDREGGRVVDVILSDMSEPWHLLSGQWVNSVSNPYHRMMNTSGVAFRDHAGSMDLCLAALSFAFDTLRTGGGFVCKFYQGAEDKDLEKKMRKMFEKVHREKPEASRDASKEAYFVALKRRTGVERRQIFDDG